MRLPIRRSRSIGEIILFSNKDPKGSHRKRSGPQAISSRSVRNTDLPERVLFPDIEHCFESQEILSERFHKAGMLQLLDKTEHVASRLLGIEVELA